jgi:hypothetical protein
MDIVIDIDGVPRENYEDDLTNMIRGDASIIQQESDLGEAVNSGTMVTEIDAPIRVI